MNSLIANLHALSLLAASHRHGFPFHLTWSVQAILALLAGILILIRPKFLTVVVAIYLIAVGLLGIIRWS